MSLTLRAKAVTPDPIWRVLKRFKTVCIRAVRALLGLAGLNIAKVADYYAPLPLLDELRRTRTLWDKPSALAGVSYDLKAMEARLDQLFRQFGKEVSLLPSYAETEAAGFGPGYPRVDALTLYLMIRHLKPKRYFEVGAGLSTFYCSLAAARNRAEGHPLLIHCIEPFPSERLRTIEGIQLTISPVQAVPVSAFGELEANDVLFIDSTHAVKIGGDVAFLFLEVVPQLQDGVFVHVHDVSFPYNIPFPASRWIFDQDWPLFWTEAMLVQAFLSFNPRYELWLSTPLIRYHNGALLAETVPGYEKPGPKTDSFSSLWLKKLAVAASSPHRDS